MLVRFGDEAGVRGPRRTVNLAHQGLQDRRPRRHLGDGEADLVLPGDFLQGRAHPQGDGVAGRRPPLLFRQVDPDLAHVGPLHEVVVAHQAVKIDGRAHPGDR